MQAFQKSHRIINGGLTASQQEMLATQQLCASTRTLEIGDLLFHQQYVRHSKLDSLFQDPHRIIEKNSMGIK